MRLRSAVAVAVAILFGASLLVALALVGPLLGG